MTMRVYYFRPILCTESDIGNFKTILRSYFGKANCRNILEVIGQFSRIYIYKERERERDKEYSLLFYLFGFCR